MKNMTYRVLDPGFYHACMRCSAGRDLHAWSYELASCLKGAAGSQIWQSGAAMPDRLALTSLENLDLNSECTHVHAFL